MASLKVMVQKVVKLCSLECAVLYKKQLAKVTIPTTSIKTIALTLDSLFPFFFLTSPSYVVYDSFAAGNESLISKSFYSFFICVLLLSNFSTHGSMGLCGVHEGKRSESKLFFCFTLW